MDCQICGQTLLSEGLTSDPSQHFCVGLTGPAIVDPSNVTEKVILVPGTPESAAEEQAIQELHSITPHNPADLAEIGRLHMENEALKTAVPNVAVAVQAGKHVSRELSLPSGEEVVVEVAVHPK